MKYQIMIHLKDDFYVACRSDENNPLAGYILSFKGVFDSLRQGFDYIYDKYYDYLKKKHIDINQIHNYMTITKIDPIKCEKWNSLFLDKK